MTLFRITSKRRNNIFVWCCILDILASTACKPREKPKSDIKGTEDTIVSVTCVNDRKVGEDSRGVAMGADKYKFALSPLKRLPFEPFSTMSPKQVDELSGTPEVASFFGSISALKDGKIAKSYSLAEIRDLESSGLLCDLETASSKLTSRYPIFGLPLGRRMIIFAYHPGKSTYNPPSRLGGASGTIQAEGTYAPVGDIPMFTRGNLNELAKGLPYFVQSSNASAKAYADGLEFTLHLVPFGTAADQITTKGELDRDGVVSIFLDTATVLSMGTLSAAGNLSKFEKVAVYGSRGTAAAGVTLAATEIAEKLKSGDMKGAGIATIKVSFVSILTTTSLIKLRKPSENVANTIFTKVDTQIASRMDDPIRKFANDPSWSQFFVDLAIRKEKFKGLIAAFTPSKFKRLPEGISKEFETPFQRIHSFLNDPNLVFAKMQALEAEVEALVRSQSISRESALTRILADWEKKTGFNPAFDLAPKVYSQSDWLAMLREKKLFNDTNFKDNATRTGPRHAELTHRLQWHAIMRDSVDSPSSYQLGNKTLADVYAEMGNPESVAKLNWTKTGVEGTSEKHLWFHLFDSFDNNFTSPEAFRTLHDVWPALGNWTYQNRFQKSGRKHAEAYDASRELRVK